MLCLVFDVSNVNLPTTEKPAGGVCNTNITSICVGCSPIEQPWQVAVAVSVILVLKRDRSRARDILESIYDSSSGTRCLILMRCLDQGTGGLKRNSCYRLGVQCYAIDKVNTKDLSSSLIVIFAQRALAQSCPSLNTNWCSQITRMSYPAPRRPHSNNYPKSCSPVTLPTLWRNVI